MRFFFLLLFGFVTFLLSCATSSTMYLAQNDTPLRLYEKESTKSEILVTVPTLSKVILINKSRRYSLVRYESVLGFASRGKFSNIKKFTDSDGTVYGFKSSKSLAAKRKGRHSDLRTSNSGGAVQVKGYYRKNGTYVRPHTRSAPKKR